MRRDARHLIVGGIGGLVGFPAFQFAPFDDLSPVNQALMAVIVAGGTMWALLTGTAA